MSGALAGSWIEHEPPRPSAALDRDPGRSPRRRSRRSARAARSVGQALARVRHLPRTEADRGAPAQHGLRLRKAPRATGARSAGALVLNRGRASPAPSCASWHARRASGRPSSCAVSQDILPAAAPQRMGGDAPLRDVLALAAREIEHSLEGAPDAQAAVQLTIGDTYRRLLMYPEAEGHLRLALERFRKVDERGLETARCLDALGAVLSAEGVAEAIPVEEEALALRKARLPAGDPLVATSERGLALALMAQPRDADVARARGLLESALAAFRAAHGEDDPEVAETNLARARLASWSDDAPAEELFASALATLERSAGSEPRDPRMIECLTDYATFLQARRRFDEADRMLARAEELTRKLYGDELTSDLLRRRANIAAARGQLASAVELTRRALAFELSRWAASRPEDANEVAGVARELETAAEPDYRHAFQLLRRFRGDGSFELARWMSNLAGVLATQDHRAQAEDVLRESLNIRCRAFGADCPIRQENLLQLGELLEQDERVGEARELFAESLAIAEKHGEAEPIARAKGALERLTQTVEHP